MADPSHSVTQPPTSRSRHGWPATAFFGIYALGTAVMAWSNRDDNWTWLLPAGLALGSAAMFLLRFDRFREYAEHVAQVLAGLIAIGLVIPGLLTSDVQASVAVLFGLLGPAVAAWLARQLHTLDGRRAALAAQRDEVEFREAMVRGLTMVLNGQELLQERSRPVRGRRVAGSRRRRLPRR